MANQQGFSAAGGVGALAKLFAHYDRTKMRDKDGKVYYERYPNLTVRGTARRTNMSAIDPERTHLNYNLAPEREGGQRAFMEKRMSEVYVHGNALKNALLDWVVTLPTSMPWLYEDRDGEDRDRTREFFEVCYAALADKYGEENVVSAYVHMDETTPHMHFAYLPIVPDPKHPQGFKLSRRASNTVERTTRKKVNGEWVDVKKVDTVNFSSAVHELLDKALCEHFGVKRSGVSVNDGEKKEKKQKKYEQTMPEFKEARQFLAETNQDIGEACERLESLLQAEERERAAIERLDREIERVGARIDEVDLANHWLRVRIVEVNEQLRQAAREFRERLNARIAAVLERAPELARVALAKTALKPALAEAAAAPAAAQKPAKPSAPNKSPGRAGASSSWGADSARAARSASAQGRAGQSIDRRWLR